MFRPNAARQIHSPSPAPRRNCDNNTRMRKKQAESRKSRQAPTISRRYSPAKRHFPGRKEKVIPQARPNQGKTAPPFSLKSAAVSTPQRFLRRTTGPSRPEGRSASRSRLPGPLLTVIWSWQFPHSRNPIGATYGGASSTEMERPLRYTSARSSTLPRSSR